MLPRAQILTATDTSLGIAQDISTRSLQTVAVGSSAGKISSGIQNAFIGVQAGAQNTTGSYITAVGYQAAAQNTNSSYATMIGAYAGAQNLSGNEVVFTGYRSGELNRYGNQHVGIGAYSLRENVSGNASVAVGYRSGERTLDGGYNTMVGALSGQDNRSGNFNTMTGYSAGRSAFLGNENTYVGAYSGYSNSYGSANSLVGYKSGQLLQYGDYNVAIGAYSMQNVSHASSNVVIGSFAAMNQGTNSINNVLIGTNVATNSAVSESVILGANAAENAASTGSVIIGYNSAAGFQSGDCNVLIGIGADIFNGVASKAISIGNELTLTSTNSISIGNSVNNQNLNSVIVGNSIISDAQQSVLLGNNISLQSVVFYKDSLFNAYTTLALNTGQQIFNILNINYTNTLQSPNSNIYTTATAAIYASNIVNSQTNPPKYRTGPISYDLLQAVSDYGIAYSKLYIIQQQYQFSNLIASPNTLYKLSSNVNANYSLCNYSQATFSNLIYSHTLSPYLAFNNITATTNIIQANSSKLQIPIYVAKKVAPPIAGFTLSNITIPTSALIASSASISISIKSSLSTDSLTGITLPHCNIQYIVTKPPIYGKLNNNIYSSNSINTVSYTSFPQSGITLKDSFEITPVFALTDNETSNYGIPANTPSKININFTPNQREIYSANQISFPIFGSKNVATKDIFAASIPTFKILPLINVYNLDPGYAIFSNQTCFSSQDIQTMATENIANYPNSAFPSLYNNILQTINTVISANIKFCYQSGNVFSCINTIASYSAGLSNYISSNIPITDSGILTKLTNIIINTNTLSNLIPYANDYTQQTYNNLAYQVSDWMSSYDIDDTLYPPNYTFMIRTNTEYIADDYFHNNLWTSWSNLNVLQNLFQNSAPSNILYAATSNADPIFQMGSYAYNLLSAPVSAKTIFSSYQTLYHKYYEVPRLFISTNDLATNTIQLSNISALSPSPAPSITFVIESSNITIPILNYSNSTVWENASIANTIYYTNSTSNLSLFQTNLPNLQVVNSYIQLPPTAGYTSATAAINANISNISYFNTNPWATNDSFDLVLFNNSNLSITNHFIYSLDKTTRRLPLTLPITALYNSYNISNVLLNIQYLPISAYNIDITSNNGIITSKYTPISKYDPNVGYYITNSNIQQSTFISLAQQASNIYNYYNYLSYTFLNNLPIITQSFNTVKTLSTNPAFSSNISIYTSNIIYQTKSYAIATNNSVIISKQNHYDHYDMNTSNYIYHSDDNLTNLQSPIIISSLQIGTSLASNIQSNYISHYNYINYEIFTPITRNFIFSQANKYSINTKPSVLKFISSNIGPVTSWSSTDKIYLTTDYSSISCNLNISLSNEYGYAGLINIGIIPIQNYNSPTITKSSLQINPSTMQGSLRTIINNDMQNLSFTPTHINFTQIDNGAIIVNNNLATIVATKDITNTKYLATGRYSFDTLKYVFSSNATIVSSIYQQNLQLIQNISPIGQSFNIGLSPVSITLNSNLFYYSIPDISPNNIRIQILSTPSGVTISKARFTLNEIFSGNISLTAASNIIGNLSYKLQNIATSPIVDIMNDMYSVNFYTHYDFPINAISTNCLQLQDIGSAGASNICTGPIWTTLNNMYLTTPQDFQFILQEFPQNGILWSAQSSSNTLNSVQYQDIIINNIRYISYTPAFIPNDTLKMKVLYKNTYVSPTYSVTIKNYISRFNSPSYNVCNPLLAPPIRSAGLIADNYTWNYVATNSNVVKNKLITPTVTWNIAQQNINEIFNPYSLSTPISFNTTNTISFTLDQADSIIMSPLLNYVSCNSSTINDCIFMVTNPPIYGIMQNIITGNSVVRFSQNEISNIVYQHLGSDIGTSDTMSIAVASTPYDIYSNQLTINFTIKYMPNVINNAANFIYFDNRIDALRSNVIIPKNNLQISSWGYLHILNTSNINATQLVTAANKPLKITLDSNMVSYSNAPYPKLSFDFAYNNNAGPAPYVNRLASLPQYSQLFKNTFTGYFNQHIDTNVILANTQNTQNITYYFNGNTLSMAQRTVSILFQVQPIFSLLAHQFDFFNQELFSIIIKSVNGIILRIDITRYTISVYTQAHGQKQPITLPTSLTPSVWNSILIVNEDINNDNNLSVYWKYQIFSLNNINLLAGYNIASIDMSQVTEITLSTPIYDPFNYVNTSNFVRKIDNGDLSASYNLNNYYVKHLFQNFELYANSYPIAQTVATNLQEYNVIVGKAINVRGTNNICIGNQFSTSGDNSIIVGNTIGITNNSSDINEVYKSIIIGNESFSETLVQNIISIGNSNLNNLNNNEYIDNVKEFMANNPIIIGNNIGGDKLAYNVNIGNVFLKAGLNNNNQIFLGNSGEYVGIGYSSNQSLPSMLSINGDIICNSISVKNLVDTVPTITAISHNGDIAVNTIVSATGVYQNNMPIVAKSTQEDYQIIGIALASIAMNGYYQISVGISGQIQVWCSTPVVVGDLLSSDKNGIAVSLGHEVSINTSTTSAQYVVRKIINGMPVFAAGEPVANSSTTTTGNLITMYTFAKSLVTWDPATTQSQPWVTTQILNGQMVGLINCLVSI